MLDSIFILICSIENNLELFVVLLCGGSVHAHSCYRWILDASQFAKSGIDWLMEGLAAGQNPFENAGSFEDLLYLETLTELNPCVSTA